jgi:hypothetical protein
MIKMRFPNIQLILFMKAKKIILFFVLIDNLNQN